MQDVTFEIGLSARATFTGPGFATNAAASDALRNLQVSPPATGADVCVAAGAVATAAVAADDAVATAFVAAPTDAAAPALESGAARVFPLGGRCAIPATATALSANVTVTEPAAAGSLVLYPGDESVPLASMVSFRRGQTRGSNAIIKIARDGSGMVGISNGAPGTVHFIVDVNGYFE